MGRERGVPLRRTPPGGAESGRYPERTMDLKRIFRGPLVYIVIAIVVVWVGSSLLNGTGFRSVSTEQGLKYLSDGDVKTAKIVDTDNRVDLELKDGKGGTNGTNVQFNFVTARGEQIVEKVDAAAAADSTLTYTDEVPQPNWLLSIGSILLPF